MPKLKRYEVVCEDEEFYFRFGRVLTERQVEEIFTQRIAVWKSQLFPGLRLQDESGQQLVPELQIVLAPVKETT
jgi:hypothetical protein